MVEVRGSGVRATPKSLALLLISLLATDSLSETEAKTKIVANFKSATKRCPLTGKKTFAGAVTAVLASEDLAKQARWLEVARGGSKSYAHISYPPDERDERMVSPVETRSSNREATSPNRAMATWVRPKKSQFGFMGAIGQSPLVLQASLNLPLDEYARALKERQMRGNITRRGKSSWRLKFDDPIGCERRTRYVTVKGTKRDAERELARFFIRRGSRLSRRTI